MLDADALERLAAALAEATSAAEALKEPRRQSVEVLAVTLVDAHDEAIAAAVSAGKRSAMRAMHRALAGWIDAGKANHEALGHCGEAVPCWERFAAGDVRGMIADAARELGVLDGVDET
jgi:hypothetical protein